VAFKLEEMIEMSPETAERKKIKRSKKISTWIVSLDGFEDAGAFITLLEKGEHFDTICFMHCINAIDEYRHIKTVGDIVRLAWRNR
jgi:hypothetical protein